MAKKLQHSQDAASKSVGNTRRRRAALTPEEKKRQRRKALGFWYTFKDGRALSLAFFKRNAWLILLTMVALVWLMSQRYSNQSKMQEIKTLEKELRRAESDELDAKAEYMSLIRENEMRKLMDKAGLDLDYQEKPPYVVAAERDAAPQPAK